MIHHAIARHGYEMSVVALVAAICLVGGFVLVVAAPDLGRALGWAFASPTQTPAPSPTPPLVMTPRGLVMAPDADCGACHLDPNGAVTTRPVPQLAHPLEGWKDCTACHADDRLVKTAPGHSGIHKADCLTCHKVPSAEGSAPPRPHHLPSGATCVSCHGRQAPLPTDMAGRTNCWICHPGTETQDLFGGPAATALPAPSVPAGN